MLGSKARVEPPCWFSLADYAESASLDIGDWLLNLTFRSWLDESQNDRAEAELRKLGPVLRREDPKHHFALQDFLRHWESSPQDVWDALMQGSVRSGIEPLTVAGLYVFEQRLPEPLRAYGAAFKPSLNGLDRAPRAFDGRLDHAYPVQMTQRFVRVNLSLPDDVLLADLAAFLKSERDDLAKLGRDFPYQEAAAIETKAHKLRTLDEIGLLPFLDLDRWQRSQGLELGFAAVRGMFTKDRSRDAELRRRVDLFKSPMKLHAWFARLDRSASLQPRRRGKA